MKAVGATTGKLIWSIGRGAFNPAISDGRRIYLVGYSSLFALTTHAAHWFLEQGFRAADVAALPKRRQTLYNWKRGSKVFLKRI